MTEREEWQKIAYLTFTLETGCRRAESRQIRKDIINAKPIVRKIEVKNEDGSISEREVVKYQTPMIRTKGRGAEGKQRRLTFGQDAMEAFKKWIEVRGEDDCPYMFVNKNKSGCSQISEGGFNSWATHTFTPIVGRRFHPHLLRESRATQAVVEDGKDIKAVQKLLGHESSETTEIYVIRDDSDDIDELFL